MEAREDGGYVLRLRLGASLVGVQFLMGYVIRFFFVLFFCCIGPFSFYRNEFLESPCPFYYSGDERRPYTL